VPTTAPPLECAIGTQEKVTSPDDDTYTVNVTVGGSPADSTQQTQAFDPNDPLDVPSTAEITITDDKRGDTASTSLNRVSFTAPGAEKVTITVTTPQGGEQEIEVPLQPDGSFDSTSTTDPEIKEKFDQWMTEDVTSVTITVENTDGGDVPLVIEEVSFCYSHMCAEGTQVNVEPGAGSMYSILVNDEPITNSDYGLFESTGIDSPLSLDPTTVIEILDLRGDRMMTMLGELIFKVTGSVDATVETMPRQGTIAKIEVSNVKEFNIYEYLQITGIIADKDIRSVIITLTKKNSDPASVVIASMKFCEKPETQEVCEAPSTVLNVNNDEKEGVTVTSSDPDAMTTAFDGSLQQFSTNSSQLQFSLSATILTLRPLQIDVVTSGVQTVDISVTPRDNPTNTIFLTYVPNGNGEITGLFESTPPIGFISTIEVRFMKMEDATEMVVSGLKLRLCGVIEEGCEYDDFTDFFEDKQGAVLTVFYDKNDDDLFTEGVDERIVDGDRIEPQTIFNVRLSYTDTTTCMECECTANNQASCGAERNCSTCVDCEMSEWSEWGSCSVNCGGGIRRRNRELVVANDTCGAPCQDTSETDFEPCNTNTCPGGVPPNWEPWSTCVANCHGGYTIRNRACMTEDGEVKEECQGPYVERSSCYMQWLMKKFFDPIARRFDMVAYQQECGGVETTCTEENKGVLDKAAIERTEELSVTDGTSGADKAAAMGPGGAFQPLQTNGGVAVLDIVVGDDLEYYYAVDNVTLEISPNVKTVKVDVYSIGPTVTLTDTKMGTIVQAVPSGMYHVKGITGMFNDTRLNPSGLIRVTLTTKDSNPAMVANVIVEYCANKVCEDDEEVYNCTTGDLCGEDGAETCEEATSPHVICSDTEDECPVRRCKCKEGTYRMEDGRCVPVEECPTTTTPMRTTPLATTPGLTTAPPATPQPTVTEEEVGEVTTPSPPATTPQPCTDTPVNLDGSTFNHPTATTADGTPVVCTLPAVTVTQCEGSCGSTSSPQVVSVSMGGNVYQSVVASGMDALGCKCCQGTPSEKSATAQCPGIGALEIKLTSFSNCQCQRCEEPETVKQNGCMRRKLQYSSLTQGWFSLDSSDHRTSDGEVYSAELALSNAADVFPNYTAVKYQAQPSPSGNYSYTITMEQGRDFTFASDLTFRLKGVANSVVVAFTDGSTENLVGSQPGAEASERTFAKPSSDKAVSSITLNLTSSNPNKGPSLRNMEATFKECGDFEVLQ
jgi:hypothetical protein